MKRKALLGLVLLLLFAMPLWTSASEPMADPSLTISSTRSSLRILLNESYSDEWHHLTNLTATKNPPSAQQTVWSYEQIGGKPVNVYFAGSSEDDSYSFNGFIYEDYPQAGVYTFKITATCGEASASEYFTLEFLGHPEGLPEHMAYSFGKLLIMKPGESYTLTPQYTPAKTTMPSSGVVHSLRASVGAKSPPLNYTVDVATGHHILQPTQPGVYHLYPEALVDDIHNIYLEHECTVLVCDNPSDVSSLIDVSMEVNTNQYSDSYFVFAQDQKNRSLFQLGVKGGTILPDARFDFKITHESGVDCAVFESKSYSPSSVSLKFKKAKALGAGEYRITACCKKYNLNCTTTFPMTVVKKLPEKLHPALKIAYDIPKMVFIKPGETLTLPEPKVTAVDMVMPDQIEFMVSVKKGQLSPQLKHTVESETGLHVFEPSEPGIYNISMYIKKIGDVYSSSQSLILVVCDDPSDLSSITSPSLYTENVTILGYEKKGDAITNALVGRDILPDDARFNATIEHLDGVDCVSLYAKQSKGHGVDIYLKKINKRALGRYAITVTCEKYNLSYSGVFAVSFFGKVKPVVYAKGIVLNKKSAAIQVEESVKLKVSKFKPSNVSSVAKEVFWDCDNTDIATVDLDGVVTGLKPGKTVIRAYASDPYNNPNLDTLATCKITVSLPKITSLSLDEETLTVERGQTLDLNTLLAIEPLDGSGTVLWKSNKPKIAKVTGKGMLTAKKPGTAKLTAYVKGQKKVSVVLTVTVTEQGS